MTPGILPDAPEYTVLTSSLGVVVEMPGEAVLFVLMLVCLVGQNILGSQPEIFEEIWEGNLPQSPSVDDHSSATQWWAATQDAARSFLRSKLLMSCGCVSVCLCVCVCRPRGNWTGKQLLFPCKFFSPQGRNERILWNTKITLISGWLQAVLP